MRQLRKRTGLPVKLVVIDPITGYLSDRIHYGNDPQVRRALVPLAGTAQETRAGVLLVRHLNKSTSLEAQYRGGGSMAFGGVSRAHMLVAWHPESPSTGVLAMVKINLATTPRSMTYQVVEVPVGSGIKVTKIKWGGAIDMKVKELLKKKDARKEAPKRDAAQAWLEALLADGPMAVDTVRKEADAAGLIWKTVERAAERANIDKKPMYADAKRGPKKQIAHWEWSLPQGSPEIRFDVS